ncbi:MAG: hypothetical protein AAGJ51_07095 [Pseudomonadota bacterium]
MLRSDRSKGQFGALRDVFFGRSLHPSTRAARNPNEIDPLMTWQFRALVCAWKKDLRMSDMASSSNKLSEHVAALPFTTVPLICCRSLYRDICEGLRAMGER